MINLPPPEAFESGDFPPHADIMSRYRADAALHDNAIIERVKGQKLAAFNPGQLRDEEGKWTDTGAGGGIELTDEEKKAISRYTRGWEAEYDVVSRMRDHTGKQLTLDELLAQKNLDGTDRFSKEQKLFISTLDGAIEKSSPLTEELTLYRGVDKWMARNIGFMKVGGVTYDTAWTSATSDFKVASSFKGGRGGRAEHAASGGAIIKLKVPPGMRALYTEPHSMFPGQKEYVLPRRKAFVYRGKEGPRHVFDVVPT